MLAEAARTGHRNDMRERRCIVTGEVRNEAQLIRFVAGPDGDVVPDLAARLPGRGFWVTADRHVLEQAVAGKLFARAGRMQIHADAGLPDRVEQLIAQRMLADLGLARRAGELTLGFDNVLKAVQGATPPALLVEARDGSSEGRRKLQSAARARNLDLPVMDGLTSAELSVALGRENVIHAALKGGRLAERVIFEAGRLKGFRPAREGIERSE